MTRTYHAFHPDPVHPDCFVCKEIDRTRARPNPDPLRPPETDTEPTCCELACYEDPGCACDGCGGGGGWSAADDVSGLWLGAVFLLVALVIGFVIGRLTA